MNDDPTTLPDSGHPAYQWRLDCYCGPCVCSEIWPIFLFEQRHEDTPVEEYLDDLAEQRGVDRRLPDQHTFPVAVSAGVLAEVNQREGRQVCATCGEELPI